MSKVDRTKLNEFIVEYFDDDELHILCAGEFRDVLNDFTNGMGKKQKVWNLTEWCYRHRKTDDLLGILQRERPKSYEDYFAQHPAPEVVAPHPATQAKRNPRQIFISHAHEDAELAQRFAHDLEAEGWDVWIAPDSIQTGERWVQAINRGLDESGVFLLLLSPQAVASKWVRSETNVAIEMEHDGELRFVPMQIKACKGLGRLHTHPFYEKK